MANLFFREGRLRIANQSHAEKINLLADTLKVLLVDTAYVPNAGHAYVSQGATAREIVATGYTGGFAGSGRRALTGKAFQLDTVNDRPEFIADDVTWTGLGGATNANIGGAVIYKHLTSDALSPIIAFLDTNNMSTNGGNLTLDISQADGLLQL